MQENFVAIIGDIINSRNLANRRTVQQHLKVTLETINNKYEENIAANFTISLGDEFQGLLSDSQNVIKIVNDIKHMMFPIDFRFGIGIGEITTDLVKCNSLEVDGPAYYQARDMIDKVKNYQKRTNTKNYKILLSSNKNNDQLINACFYLLSTMENNWTLRQREVIYKLMDYKFAQKAVANELHITSSTVSRTKSKANIDSYLTALEAIEKALQKVGETDAK